MNPVEREIDRLIERLVADQAEDGSWHYPFETGISTDCYMIILLRTLELHDEDLIKELVERIVSRQEPNGSWKIFHDETDGHLTATIEAYYALLYSGYLGQDTPVLQKAKHFILTNGGISKAHMFTKIMLALTGQYDWPHFPISILVMLLPVSFPINLYDFSVYARANLIPILILEEKGFRLTTEKSPDLSDLYVHQDERRLSEALFSKSEARYRFLLSELNHAVQMIKELPDNLYQTALNRAKRYMIDHIEPDGTFYNYFSATFLMIFALLALGHSKEDPLIRHAVHGLKAMVTEIDGKLHCQYTTATVWNTALASYILQEAGMAASEPVIRKANRYLLSRQHHKYGDWHLHNPAVPPGGWGFSHFNTINPDVDDTTAALRAIRALAVNQKTFREAWDRGIHWVVSMQNEDGGWPAFEKKVNKKFLNLLPIEGAQDLLLDPSTADLTGRTLEFFGGYTHLDKNDPIIQQAVRWLYQNQKADGSWSGRWGAFIYGTWAALSGLAAVGVSADQPTVAKGLAWLKRIQNADGGWGESAKSDMAGRFVPLGTSTRTHTAWALDAFILNEKQVTPEISKGIDFLVHKKAEAWTKGYPEGNGMAGAFYIHYHVYEYVWPLLALAHFKNKFL